MKKIIVSLLLLVAMVVNIFAMTGCSLPFGGGGTNASASEAVAYDGSAVTITFYHTMGANLRGVLDNAIVEFNKLYPNITIEHSQQGGYDDIVKMVSDDIAAGNQPNIAYCYADHVAAYNVSKAVLTLDNFIACQDVVERADGTTEIVGLTEAQIADFIKAYYDEGAVFGDGLMYSLPLSKSTEVLYYDKDFFEAEGLAVPTTWEEMENVCKTIKEKYPDSIPLGYDSEANWFITLCEQYGAGYTSATGDHFLFDNDKCYEFVKMIRDWYQKGYVTTEELYGGYTSGLFTKADGTRSYMCIGSSAGATYQCPAKDDNGNYRFEVGITSIPQVDAANNAKVISQGPSLCIFKDSDPQQVAASWLFVKYLTTNVNFQAEFSMVSGYVPVIKSVNENAAYAAWLAKADGNAYIQALSVKTCLAQEKYYFTSPAFNGSSTARMQVGALLQACVVIKDEANLDALMKEAFANAIAECEFSAGN